MTKYTEDSKPSPEQTPGGLPLAVIQNLEDAGCDKKTLEQFVGLEEAGEEQGQLRLHKQHRRNLLEKVHKNQKHIDYLDYLVFQMKKKRNRKIDKL